MTRPCDAKPCDMCGAAGYPYSDSDGLWQCYRHWYGVIDEPQAGTSAGRVGTDIAAPTGSTPVKAPATEALRMLVAYAECDEAYKKANQSNDWIPTLTAAGWDGKSNPRPFINTLRTLAVRLAREATGSGA